MRHYRTLLAMELQLIFSISYSVFDSPICLNSTFINLALCHSLKVPELLLGCEWNQERITKIGYANLLNEINNIKLSYNPEDNKWIRKEGSNGLTQKIVIF